MPSAERLQHEFGPALLFVNVLLERLGVPIPAMPTMIVAGAAAASGDYPLAAVLAAALFGAAMLRRGRA
jgi:membrane protein DedA with SNARE-associated domain